MKIWTPPPRESRLVVPAFARQKGFLLNPFRFSGGGGGGSPYTVGTLREFSRNATGQTTVDATNFTAVAGDALLAYVSYFQVDQTVTLSDTVGSNDTWNELETGQWDAGQAAGQKLFLLDSASAGSCTIRATFGGVVAYPGIAVVPISGLHATPFLDAVFNLQATPTTATDAVTSGNLGTLASQPAGIFGFSIHLPSSATPAAGTGFTNIGTGWDYEASGVATMRAEHKRVTVTTADDATFTIGTNSAIMSCAVALREP